ncbi:Ig-like domain-containing protein [Candidatus Marinimicrobia bacterium]|nr:Ig-like domain-containing protein [Candidatus Neomarinimicrobiota bacterium]
MKKIILISSIFFLWTCGGGGGKKATGPVEPPTINPPTVSDVTINTNEDVPATFNFLGSDPQNLVLTYNQLSDPEHGTLTVSGAAGSYTPSANYYGSDTFTYNASNGTNSSGSATVNINIVAVDDEPQACDITVVTDEDIPIGITFCSDEYDGDSYSFSLVSDPSSGTVTLSGKTAIYTPSENWYGTDSFTFQATDNSSRSILTTATATVVVTPINDAPIVEDMSEIEGTEDQDLTINLSGTDIEGDNLSFEVVDDPAHGTITVNGTSFVYTPDQDFYGLDSLSYQGYDGTDYGNTSTIPLFVNRGTRDWPFIYNSTRMNNYTHNVPRLWEGKMVDYNNDGRPDYVTAGLTYNPETGAASTPWTIDVTDAIDGTKIYSLDWTSLAPTCINCGDLTIAYREIASRGGGSSSSYYPSMGDINGDGLDDFAESIATEKLGATPGETSFGGFATFVALTKNNSPYEHDLVLLRGSEEPGGASAPNGTLIYDFDGDGDNDVSMTSTSRTAMDVYINDGSGQLTETSYSYGNGLEVEQLMAQQVADINSDGHLDIVGGGGHPDKAEYLTILYGTSTPGVYNTVYSTFEQYSYTLNDITLVDLDNDGIDEILMSREYGFDAYGGEWSFKLDLARHVGGGVYAIDPTAGFYEPNLRMMGPIYLTTTAWDFDGDGDKDIFLQQFFPENNEYGQYGYKSCHACHIDDTATNNNEIVHGFYWHNDNGTLVKTNLSARPDACVVDFIYGQDH